MMLSGFSEFLLLSLLFSLCNAAVPPLQPGLFEEVLPGSPPQTPNNQSNRGLFSSLWKRQTCTFDSGGFCSYGESCCGQNTTHGYCCQGPCCGTGCCDQGEYCVYADYTGAISCCASGQDCSPPPATVYVSNYVTLTNLVTNVVTNILTSVQTVTGAGEPSLQTEIQTQTETFKILITTNGAGQTLSVTVDTGTGGGSQPTAQRVPISSPSLSSTSSLTTSSVEGGAIAGGVVGGVAVLSLLSMFFFLGFRRGWFAKKHQYAPADTPGIDAGDRY